MRGSSAAIVVCKDSPAGSSTTATTGPSPSAHHCRPAAETELQKRLRYVYDDHGWIGPHLTSQAYVRRLPEQQSGRSYEVMSVAMTRTADLIGAITQGYARQGRPGPGGNGYVYVDWATLMEIEGAKVRVWRPSLLQGEF